LHHASPARLIEAQEENALAYETLTYRRDDSVAVTTLNRPERLNAIKRRMPCPRAELDAAV
jgi:enoyl-CoA hydratase/carnithine racemase